MALRVLLADESTTIKKVMQLALQDFAVEVKAVHAGIDVIEVAKSFHPDIVFADVLLQKKNGYEVCAELKNDPQLNRLPIVLMWSSFLEVDERLASRCGADERLEKPFDVETLRQLILKLVPATRTQRLAHFLDFSQNVTAAMKAENVQNQSAPPPQHQSAAQGQSAAAGQPPPQLKRESPAVAHPPAQIAPQPPAPIRAASPQPAQGKVSQKERPTDKSNWNMDSFEDISAFSEMESHASHSPVDDEPASMNVEDHLQLSEMSEMSQMSELSHFSLEDNDDNNEGFSEFKLSDLSRSGQAGQAFQNPQDAPPRHRPPPESSTEAWSHQDLSAFKIELAPVPVEGEGFALTFNVNDPDVEGTGYSTSPDLRPEHGRPHDIYEPQAAQYGSGHGSERASGANHDAQAYQIEEDHQGSHSPNELMLELDDQGLATTESNDSFSENSVALSAGLFGDHFEIQPLADPYQAPRQPMPLEYAPPQSHLRQTSSNSTKASPTRSNHEHRAESPISEERLEEIIRAQSQAVIEAVVRRLVPEIATQIIQRELARLLDDSPPSE